MTRIQITKIDIGSLERGSAVFHSPNNKPINWESFKSENQGFGEIEGEKNRLKNIISGTDDSDTVDET